MKKITLVCFLLFEFCIAFAQTDVQRKRHFNIDETQLAISGYDVVSYLKNNKALKGNEKYSTVSGGVKYYFSSDEHLKLFKQNPEKYEPSYGGWCAYAMGNSGEKVEVDPETFKIINGKTYLFYNFYFNNTLKSWNKAESSLKAKADSNWNKIISEQKK